LAAPCAKQSKLTAPKCQARKAHYDCDHRQRRRQYCVGEICA
jgi:hypothetical protein